MSAPASTANPLSRRQRRYFHSHLLFEATLGNHTSPDVAQDAIFHWAGRKYAKIGERLQKTWQDQQVKLDDIGVTFEAVSGVVDANHMVWACQLRHPDSKVAERMWDVSAVIVRAHDGPSVLSVRVGSEDTAKGLDRPVVTPPGFVTALTHDQALYADGGMLRSSYKLLREHDEEGRDDLTALITNPNRRLPVFVACTVPPHQIGATHNLTRTSADLAGMAHFYLLNRQGIARLCDQVGPHMSIEPGEVRMFRPGFLITDPETANPKLSLDRQQAPGTPYAIRQMAVYSSAERLTSDEVLPSYLDIKAKLQGTKRGMFRTIVGTSEATPTVAPAPSIVPVDIASLPAPVTITYPPEAPTSPAADPAELLQLRAQVAERDQRLLQQEAELSSLRAEVATLTELVEVGDSERDQLATKVGALQEDNRSLQTRLESSADETRSLRGILEAQQAPAALSAGVFPPLTELSDWAQTYAPHLVFSAPGLKSGERSTYKNPALVFKALLMLSGPYRDRELYGAQDASLHTHFTRVAESLHLPPSFSAAPATRLQYRSEYFRTFEGYGERELDYHLTAGRGDERTCLRIYFAKDLVLRPQDTGSPSRSKVAVGWLTSHLSYSKSN
jgi:hypothetical protein